MVEILPLDKIMEKVGQELGVTDWLQVEQDRINEFANCTGDHQWIHVDLEKAAQGPFGKPIAHGYLTISLIPQFSADIGVVPEGTKMGINYGLNKVRLLNPVTVGSKIRDRVTLGEVTEKSDGRILIAATHTIEIEGEEKPALVAETLSMFFTS